MRLIVLWAAALVLAAPVYSQTPPSAPSLSAGPDFKGLRFDWEPAAGVGWYELEYQANRSAAFTQLGSDLPASATSFRYRFPLHLFDWTYARYRLAACNAAGCSRSGEISVSNLRRDAVGYFKADVAIEGLQFGYETDVSPDGLNFAVAAPNDAGPASAVQAGTVYVFRRGANGTWTQRGKLQALPSLYRVDFNEMRVKISADGNTVVVGLPTFLRESLAEEEVDRKSGEVFVFHHDGTRWNRSRLYTGANDRGRFGNWVGINDAGDVIAVDAGDSSTYAVPRNIFVYRKINGTWQPVRGIGSRLGSEFCQHGALSGDGSTIVETCREGTMTTTTRHYVRIHSGPNWTVREEVPLALATPNTALRYSVRGITVDDTGTTFATQMAGFNVGQVMSPVEVQVFRREGTFARVAVLTPGAWRSATALEWFGVRLALSGDGRTLAIGDPFDNGYGTGPRAAPLDPTESETGAVYVYRYRDSWRLSSMVKPNYVPNDLNPTFAMALSLDRNGQTLLVGNTRDSSSSVGIGGDWTNTDSFNSGGVFLY